MILLLFVCLTLCQHNPGAEEGSSTGVGGVCCVPRQAGVGRERGIFQSINFARGFPLPMGFSERNANICLLLPTCLDTNMMVWAGGRVAYEVFQNINFARGFPLPMGFSERSATIRLLLPPTDSFRYTRGPLRMMVSAHRSSRLKGFRVRTSAVTPALPKRTFWQLWGLPKAFSRGETCFPPSCSLQEAHRSSRLKGFRARTSAETPALPKRPFLASLESSKSIFTRRNMFSTWLQPPRGTQKLETKRV